MNVENKLVIIVCIAFVILIATPMVVSVVQVDEKVSETEKRSLQLWPVYREADSIQAYFASINTYVNDHFGFRGELIELNNKIRYSLNESPVKQVVRGDDDWLFLKYHDSLMDSDSVKKETIKSNIVARTEYIQRTYQQLAEKDIAYQHIVASNKMSLYSEHLPALYGLTNINASYDFFKSNMQKINENVGFNALDVLLDKKTNEYNADLYFKNDTHWNDLGAYYVYHESITRLKQNYPGIELKLSMHLFELRRKYSGDLAVMIGLQNRLMAREARTSFNNCTSRSKIKLVRENLSMSSCNANSTTMLLIGDSFMSGIYAYMSESVGTLYMSHQKASRAELRKTIEEIKPDIVVEILVERSLGRPLR